MIPTFEEMINKAYQQLNREQLDRESSSNSLILPSIETEITTTRLHWKNTGAYLQAISRDHENDHFMSFLKRELPGKEISWFSGSRSDGLIIHGKRQNNKEITALVLKYVNVYVICPSCKRANTFLTKESSKNDLFECSDCGMKKYM